VIDEIGIEGQVIRYGLVVALLMTWATAIMTMLQAFAITVVTLSIVGIMIALPIVIGLILFFKGRNSEEPLALNDLE